MCTAFKHHMPLPKCRAERASVPQATSVLGLQLLVRAAELTVSFRASVTRLRAYVVREFELWLGGSSASVVCELLVILRGPDVHELGTDVHCNKKKILILIKKNNVHVPALCLSGAPPEITAE